MARMLVVLVAMMVAASAAPADVKVHSYLDAFCGSEQYSELYTAGTCADNGEGGYSVYMVDAGGVSHCDWDNAACLGDTIRCVKDGRVSGKCYQTSLTTSKKFEFASAAPEAHSLSFDEQASSSARSSSGRAPVYSSTGSSVQPITSVQLQYYPNSTTCSYISGVTTTIKTYTVGTCYSPYNTLIGQYYEIVTITKQAGDNSQGYWCRYASSGCNNLISCTSFSKYTCDGSSAVPGRNSIKIYWGWDDLLAGLATLVIVLIVIGVLIFVGSILTCCCCGAAAAAIFGRLCCGLCGNRHSSTEYHVRLTA